MKIWWTKYALEYAECVNNIYDRKDLYSRTSLLNFFCINELLLHEVM